MTARAPEVADLSSSLNGSGDGVHWTLDAPGQLNANLVRLGPGHTVAEHTNDEVDVVVVVLSGAGAVTLDGATSALRPLVVAHVPRGTAREVTAGPEGLAFLTVHVRRGPLTMGAPRQRGASERSSARP